MAVIPAPLSVPATERVPEAAIVVHASDCNVVVPVSTHKFPVAIVTPPLMLAPPVLAVKRTCYRARCGHAAS